MKQYLDLLKNVKENGYKKDDRTGIGTISSFGHQLRFNLQDGFPIVTTKFTAFRLVVSELLWFLRGETNIKSLVEENNNIWNDWATESGDLGPIYGKQWRSWGSEGFDQVKHIINGLKTNPYSRRHIISAWNVSDLPNELLSPQENVTIGKMALAPCHTLIQFYVSPHNKLSCQVYQRSQDLPLGGPFNYASYALFTHMIAQVCNLGIGDLIYTIGDAHIYTNQLENLDELFKREPLQLPKLELNSEIKNIDEFTINDIKLIDYNHHAPIKFEIAV